ncbi:hypothetical protein CYOC110262_04730 [Cytobacillus oceanisediminis]|jgi:hypothetical protein|uniref:Uncharacterized protein n=1 Tax=Cytobacillus oceanisediminis TaxID=665099 RepID=A0A2V2ZJ06_9BACI|nr:hypothetical protein DFO73_11916 [Cytobacillus oceanisediminis]TWH84792.1 hypothetical protein IQ19_03376 [Cytobacillus oceanisediminis]
MFVAHPCYNRSEQVVKSAQLCLAASADKQALSAFLVGAWDGES